MSEPMTDMTLIRGSEVFESSYLIFANNTICYPNKDRYLMVQTPPCTVLYDSGIDTEGGLGILWVDINHEWFVDLINDIDVQRATQVSSNLSEYFQRINVFQPTLRLIPNPSTGPYAMPIYVRSYTKKYGDIICGKSIQALITANYNNGHIIWSAHQIKGVSDSQEPQPEFQKCLLEQKLIKI